MRARRILAVAMLAVMSMVLAGCSGSVSQLWVQQNQDYQRTVVDGVLLPHYMADPAISQAAKDNVAAATAEHKQFLDHAEAPTANPPG